MKVSGQQLRQIIREEIQKELLTEQSFSSYRKATLTKSSARRGKVRSKDYSMDRWLRKHPAQIQVVNFWASWCGPCKAELPHFKKVMDNLNSRGYNVKFIPISGPMPGSDQAEENLGELSAPTNRAPNIAYSDGNRPKFRDAGPPLTFILENGKVMHTKVGKFKGEQEFGDILYRILGLGRYEAAKKDAPGEKVDPSRPSFPSCGPEGSRGTLTCKCHKTLPGRPPPAGAVWCLGMKDTERPGRRWPVKCPKEYPTKGERQAVWTLCRK